MKKRIMLQKANKILAAVMTASMLTSTIVPGTVVYASEFTAAEVETEAGFTDGMEKETPVVTQEQEEMPEFEDGSAVAAETETETPGVNSYTDLKNAVENGNDDYIKLNKDLEEDESCSDWISINRSLTIDLNGHTIKGNKRNRIFTIAHGCNVTIKSSESQGHITNGSDMNGGAIYNKGTTVINNICIDGNEASMSGGGIYSDSTGNVSLTLIDVEIKNNTALWEGAGIYSKSDNTLVLGGKIVISNNTIKFEWEGENYQFDRNLYLENIEKKCISIDTELGLDTGSNIRLSVAGASENGNIVVRNFRQDYLQCFHSDSEEQKLGFRGNDQNLYIATKELPGLLKDTKEEYSGIYDGGYHKSVVSPGEEGETVEYKKSTEDDSAYTSTAPEFKDAGEYTVDYRIKKGAEIERSGQLTVKISPKEITVNGITADNKQYDGNDEATLNVKNAEFNGIVDCDKGYLGVTATGKFAHAYADTTGPTVVKLSELYLTGDSARNYTLLTEESQKETSAWLSWKQITVSITPNGGTYGGIITPTAAKFNGLIKGEEDKLQPTLYYSGTAYNGTVVEDSTEVPTNAGIYTVRATNDNGNNYNLTGENTAEFKIEPKSLNETSVVVNAKSKNEFEVLVKDENELKENEDYTIESLEKDGVFTVTITGKGNYTGSIVKKITSVEKTADGKGNIATAVTPEDDTVAAMKPSLEISEENAKNLLIDSLNDKKKITDIISDPTNGSYDATVYLEMKALEPEDIKGDVEEDVAKVEALIEGGKVLPSSAKIGQNLDLKLMMNCVVRDSSNAVIYSGNQSVKDTTGKSEQKITFTIPDSLKTTAAYTTRTYYVICVHNRVAEVVPSTLSGDKLSFNATKFSTYTIAYKDTYYSPVTPSYPVTGIKVSTDKVNLTKKGETAQVKVEVTPSYADNKNLTWKSSDEKVATVDKDGKITAVGNGTATITVTSVSGNYTATITVTVNDESEVKPAEIEKITIDTEAKTLTKIGESVELKVKVEPENADSSKLTWKSDNEKVAVVDKDGKVTAVGNGTATITVSTEDGKHTATVTITVKVADEPAANKTTSYGNLKARSVKQTNNSITLEWTRVSGVDGYLIYGNRCNGNGKTYKYQKLAAITNSKTRTWTQKDLKKGTYYKYIVKAYKLVNGKKVVTDTSVSVHAVTKGGKYGVAKAVSVTKIGNKKNTLKVTLKNGKTAQITAKEVKMDKPIRHHRNLCYESSNTKVATVTPDGLIQATGKGTCSIWVYAQNGVYKTITVTVK